MPYLYTTMKSPVGLLTLVASDAGLAAVLWENDDPRRVRIELAKKDASHPVLVKTSQQLREYFAGQRKKFTVKLELTGFAGGLPAKRLLLQLESA